MKIVGGYFVIFGLVRQQAAEWFYIQGRWFFHFFLFSLLRFPSLNRRNESKFFHLITFLNFTPEFHFLFYVFFFFVFGLLSIIPNQNQIGVGKMRLNVVIELMIFFRFHFQFPSCDENIKYNHVIKLSPFHHLNFHPRSFASAMRKLFFCFGVDSCLFNLLLHRLYSSFPQKHRAFFSPHWLTQKKYRFEVHQWNLI